jgi:hypothetical protein
MTWCPKANVKEGTVPENAKDVEYEILRRLKSLGNFLKI